MKYVKEYNLQYAFVMMVNKLIYIQEFILKPLKEKLEKMSSSGVETQLAKIRNKISEVQEKMESSEKLHHQGYLSATVYQNLNLKLTQEYESFIKQETQIIRLDSKHEKWKLEMEKTIKNLNKRDYLQEYDDELFIEIIEKIIVLSREKVRFVLKCRLELEERMV